MQDAEYDGTPRVQLGSEHEDTHSDRPREVRCWNSGNRTEDVRGRPLLHSEIGLPHIYGHGVSEEEVEQVLRASGGDVQGSRGLRTKLGRTSARRYLQVIYSPDEQPGGVFVITAYELTGKAKKAYRRRRRRKPR